MNTKIVIILEGEHHCQNFRNLLKKSHKNFSIYGLQDMEKAGLTPVELAESLIQTGAEVIISAGKYGEDIVQAVDIPVVRIHRSKISFATAVKEARSYSPAVAILARDGVFFNAASQYTALFNEGITVESFIDDSEIPDILNRLKRQGIQVLVTGTRGRRRALANGFRCVSVPFEEEDMVAAIQEAEHILRYVEMRIENTQILQTIQNNISEGLIALDNEGIITEINRPALEIFSLAKSFVVGKQIEETDFSPIAQLPAYKRKETCYGELIKLNGSAVSVTLSPIIVSNVSKAFLISFSLAEQIERREQSLRAKLYSKGHVASYTFDQIIGDSACMKQVISEAKKYAVVDSTILINGPSGSGKEIFAQSIHNISRRRNQPFVVINCAALPESLLESILFGYEKGAYTGALKEGKKGLFEIAHGGTVFLDEISEMSLDLQARFLRVIQEKEISPVGSDRVIPIDVRIISATNRNMEEMVAQGRFREDLFYRIAVLWLNVPSLSRRREDIPALVRHFLSTKSAELKIPLPELSPKALQYLCNLPYPGNIRQLGNVVERLLVLSGGYMITLELAEKAAVFHPTVSSSLPVKNPQETEKEALRQALLSCSGNRAETAAALNISVTTLWRKMKRYNLL
ncbi:sigma 54-interacting transcriptional regulator [Enterocloster asparagiformis]|uniref:sigma 54-interacting transcriptional regulator n=1 Tax=Enterocloster asparagiformis TaxID=333367 RepID=UPI002A814F9A|nr:sigma 54-interacting transcriptional regulator [Enterocloster asparagiformis]